MPGLDKTGPAGSGAMSGMRCGAPFGAGRGGGGRGSGFMPRPWFDATELGATERERFTDEALSERRAALAAELARMDALIAKTHIEKPSDQ